MVFFNFAPVRILRVTTAILLFFFPRPASHPSPPPPSHPPSPTPSSSLAPTRRRPRETPPPRWTVATRTNDPPRPGLDRGPRVGTALEIATGIEIGIDITGTDTATATATATGIVIETASGIDTETATATATATGIDIIGTATATGIDIIGTATATASGTGIAPPTTEVVVAASVRRTRPVRPS